MMPLRTPPSASTRKRILWRWLCAFWVSSLITHYSSLFSAEAEPAGDEFIFHTAGGEKLKGGLGALDEKWAAEVSAEKTRRLPAGELVSIRRSRVPLPEKPALEQAMLANGDQLPGRVLELKGETIRFEADLGTPQVLTIPLADLSALWLAKPEGTEQTGRWQRRLLTGRRTRDVVYLRNGDSLEGIISAIEGAKPRKLVIEIERKEVALEFSKIAAIAFNTDLVRANRPRGSYGHVVLANGGRLTVASAEKSGRNLICQTALGAEVRIPLTKLMAVDVRQGRADYVSDLKASRYDFTPFLDVTWPYVRDGSVAERDLRLDSGVYDKGLGLRAGGRLAYDLGGKYRRFEAVVGLDEPANAKAAARIQVLVDGKPRLADAERVFSSRRASLIIQLDVQNARELVLVVEPADQVGAIPGDVNWCDARLIK